MAWIPDYIDDLDADFRTFYRFPESVSEPGISEGNFGGMSSARFFRLAERTPAFSGVMAARLAAEKHEEEKRKRGTQQGPAPTPARSTSPASQERKVVTLHQLMLLDPSLVQYEKV